MSCEKTGEKHGPDDEAAKGRGEYPFRAGKPGGFQGEVPGEVGGEGPKQTAYHEYDGQKQVEAAHPDDEHEKGDSNGNADVG
jgi:hypothetical protein